MNLKARLSKIESELSKAGNVVIRLVGYDGKYPEQEQDKEGNNKIIKIMVEGMFYEELRSWAK